ncbi:hypothetical protein LOD99_1824 [Oopsacas minuta]|uniref:Uncharacterized protein n=1 Tax=Oopsacas minuta TaxID=111878 RepID=A0AAV7K5G1_9METZ|nr:hypothetical protein LOD99_1824 [Oopsacas minuta]
MIFKLEFSHREHCIPDSDATAIELVVSELKMKAKTQLTPIPTLYCDAAATLSVSRSIASRFPLVGQIDSTLYRERLCNLPLLLTSRETFISYLIFYFT